MKRLYPYVVGAMFGWLVFEITRAWLSWQIIKWAFEVCKHFDYNDVPWPGVDFWVSTCSNLF